MLTVETILESLLKLQVEHAGAVLARPLGKKGFDYGVAAGRYQGVQLAVTRIKELVEASQKLEEKEG